MATAAEHSGGTGMFAGERGFFLKLALAMAAVLVAGFSTDLLLARVTFALPLIFHLHAITFFGWVALYLAQNILVAGNNVALHRRLGWLALGWIPAMVALGIAITVYDVRQRGAGFFFAQNEFLIGNPLGILTFAGLAGTAIALRRRTDWHRRLMACAMATLTGPGFGRMLPMPFLIPWCWWIAAFVVPSLFPVIGMIADKHRTGAVHPAWLWGIGTSFATMLLGDLIAYSPIGLALTHWVIDGTPGAQRPMAAFLPPGFGT